MKSAAATVPEYLASLPAERRRELAAVRAVLRKHLPKGYAEMMQYGMISYVVPLKLSPVTEYIECYEQARGSEPGAGSSRR